MSAPPIRLAALAAGPVIYQTPLYRLLAADPRIDLTVILASNAGVRPYDAGFGAGQIVWDVDLLDGYNHEFLARADRNEDLGGVFSLRDWDVYNRIRYGSYDVVWCHGCTYLTHWLAFVAARRAGIPVLIRDEQTLLERRPWHRRGPRYLILRALMRNKYGLYIGTANRNFFTHYGVREDRLFFAPYCVDNASLRQTASDLASARAEIRTSFGLDRETCVILFVGKFVPKKQPLQLLEAFARIRENGPASLLMVGEGPLGTELRRRVRERQIPDVVLAGFLNRSEIGRAYAAADLLVLPSAFHETFGLVVNEAMNFGMPVVVSDRVGCAADLVRNGVNGWVVPSGDVGALADALRALVTDPQTRSDYGERSFEMIADWSYETARDGIVAACEAAVGRVRPERAPVPA